MTTTPNAPTTADVPHAPATSPAAASGSRAFAGAVAGVVCLLLVLVAAPAHAALPSERQWSRDVAVAMKGSKGYVDQRVATADGRVLAVNFDIDNSSLATQYRPGTAIPAVLDFALHAHGQGVALLFNTARYGKKLAAARALLENAGYPVTALCGRTSAREGKVHSKQRCRAAFIEQGYTIIANVGNRSTDFAGNRNYGRAYDLPDYGNRIS